MLADLGDCVRMNDAIDEVWGNVTKSFDYTREIKRVGAVPLSTKIFQGFGGIVNSHKDFAFGTFLLLYYSQILGLSASLVSVVIAISLLIDAITDPIVGSISDNYKSKLGRRHPFMYGAAIPFGVSMYFLFAPPQGMNDWLVLSWLLFFTVTARLAFTFFIVPWHAIAAEFSDDYVERTSIITFRYMVGWTGGVIFSILTYQLIFPNTEEYPAGILNPEMYSFFGFVVACLVILWALISTHGTRKEIPYLLQPTKPTPRFSLKRVIDEVILALKNANFRRLFFLFVMFSGLAGIGGVFDIYMNTYFWEFTSDDLPWFAVAAIGAIAAFITIPAIQRRLDKQIVLQYFLGLFMIGAILKVCFRFWGIWPDNGDPLLLQLLIVHAIVQIYLITTCGIMVGSLIADLMDEQELETSKRQEGVFSAAISFSSKATSSIGIIIGGFLLDFVVVMPTQAALGSVDEDTLFRLAVTDGVVIPLLFFVPIYLTSRITMTRKRLAEVQVELKERRGLGTSTE
ncbi:MAG: MFS transporter [Pseudomonadales bacterium]|jgi:Na+/melibiose symporter-like transporter